VLVAIAGFLVVVLGCAALVGGYFVYQNGGLPSTAPTPPGFGEKWEPASGTEDEAARLMAQGAQHSGHGRYFDAAGRYYKVIKLDGAHPEARRRGYMACENIAFDVLSDDLVSRDVNERAMKKEIRSALRQGQAAIGGKANLADTFDLLHGLSTRLPAHAALADTTRKVKSAAARFASSEAGQELQAAVAEHVEAGFSALASGDLESASSAFNTAVETDPDRQTPQYFRAQDGLHAVAMAQSAGG
jgi:hypothetical protein